MEVVKEILMVVGIISILLWGLKVVGKIAGISGEENNPVENDFVREQDRKCKDYVQDGTVSITKEAWGNNSVKRIKIEGDLGDVIMLTLVVGGLSLIKKALEETDDS